MASDGKQICIEPGVMVRPDVYSLHSKVPKFMLFKFVILFQSFSHFNVMLSIIYTLLLPRHSTPIMQCRRYSTPHHFHFNLSAKSMRFRSILYNFPSPFVYSQTIFISTPFALLCLSTFPTIIKLFFPRRFSLSAS